MSEFSEQNNLQEETSESESTIFSDPALKESKKPLKKKGFLVKILSAFLAVVLLIGGTIAVIKLIPEKTDGEEEIKSKEISLLTYDSADFAAITIANQNGTFAFSKKTKEEDSKKSEVWCLENYDYSLLNTDQISNIVSSLGSVVAVNEVKQNDRPLSDFGLDKPQITATVDFKSEKKQDYTISVGSVSPDNTGTYISVSTKENIYIVEDSFIQNLQFEALDLADSSAFAAASFSGDVSEYLGDSETLETFDKMTISGANFPETVVIEQNNNEELAVVLPFLVTKPQLRQADNVDSVLSLFSTGLTADGAYTFDVSAASLKEYRLDTPDVIVSITVKNQTKTFKISRVDDSYCAVINDDSKLIKKVAVTNLSVATFKATDFYDDLVCMESIMELSNFTLKTGDAAYGFDIKYDEKSEDEQYTITLGDKSITAEKFKTFYQEFLLLKCIDFTTETVSAKPDAEVILTHSTDNSKMTYSFYKVSESKYQYSLDGKPLGKISAIAYNKLMKNAKLIAENKSIT